MHLLRTAFHGSIRSAAPDLRIPYPVGLFLETDPLVALATALSTGTLYRHLWWAVPFVLLALVVGRAFCGWVCPLGTLLHWVGTWRSDVKRGARLVESNRYKRWQAAKYYVLAGVLALAAAGSAAGLLLDPISLLVRSMTAAVLPAMSLAVRAGLETISGWPLGPARVVVDTTATVFNLDRNDAETMKIHLQTLDRASGARQVRLRCLGGHPHAHGAAAQMIETEMRRLEKMQQFVTAEEVAALISAIGHLAKRVIKDPKVLNEFTTELLNLGR